MDEDEDEDVEVRLEDGLYFCPLCGWTLAAIGDRSGQLC